MANCFANSCGGSSFFGHRSDNPISHGAMPVYLYLISCVGMPRWVIRCHTDGLMLFDSQDFGDRPTSGSKPERSVS